MPQLNKIRIVNFFYNDGNRLIADELYDFKNTDAKAPNVLINLANGGGKSVLVQLIMQPILPKAKASGRKIESFFTKPEYHSYVLLEWQKDNSPEKLLTGISMRTASSSDKDESTMGRKVQYYTFYSEYMYDFDDESLSTLKLSTKENGNFIAAEYDYIKKLSKNKNRIKCYSQDKSREWKEKLQEFYIYTNEWEMIEKINAVEGGLDKFFEEYRSSDSLINKLIIPVIENQIHSEKSEVNTEDTSLTTMFLGYADSYRKSADNLKKQELYKKYKSALTPFVSSFENLFNLEDKKRTSERKLYGFADALAAKKSQFEINNEEIQQEIRKNEDEIYKIEYEKVSEKYYFVKRKYEVARHEKEIAENSLSYLKQEKEQLTQDIKIQECARYFEKISSLKSEATAIKKQIECLENHSDLSNEICNLKYSVHMLAKEKISTLLDIIGNDENTLLLKELEQNKLSEKKQELDKKQQKIQNEKSEKCGKLEQIKEYTDDISEKNNFEIRRNILGVYESADIQILENKINSSIEIQNNIKQEITKNIEELKNQKDKIPQKIAELNQKLSVLNQNKNKIQSDINKYESDYDAVCKICEEYQLDTSMIFRGQLAERLKKLFFEKEENSIKLKSKINNKEKLLFAAENGNVHIQKEVIDFLTEENISYNTCENYLLEQIKKNTMNSEKVLELLDKYPFLAYSVIIENDEYEKICSCDETKWLSTTVPVFNNQEIDRYLQQSVLPQKFISSYSYQLFTNQDKFIKKLQTEISALKTELETIETEKDEISQKQNVVEDFEYTSDWLSTQKYEMLELEKNIISCNKKINEYEEHEKQINSKIIEQEYKKENIIQEISNLKSKKINLENMADNVQKEQNLSEEITHLKDQLKSINQNKQKVEQELDIVNRIIEETNFSLVQNREQYEFAKEAYSKTDCYKEANIVDGTFEDLYNQYQEISKKQSTKIEDLKEKLNDKNESIGNLSFEITNRKIDKSLYENVRYNEQKYENLKKDLSNAETALEKTSNIHHEKDKILCVAENNLKDCNEALKKYGEPLPENQIHMDFDRRIQEAKQIIEQLNSKLSNIQKKINEMINILDRLEYVLGDSNRSENAIDVQLQENIKEQFEKLQQDWNSNKKSFFKALNQEKINLDSVINNFEKDNFSLKNTLQKLKDMLNMTENEYIYSLNDMVKKYIDNASKMIHKIESDLKDLDSRKHHLAYQCTIRAKQIYDGLEQIKNAKTKVYENKQPKNMLKIDIPDNFDRDSAQRIIESELENNVEEIASREFPNDEQLRKEASKFVNSGQLLRIAIQKNNLTIKTYKIDKNPDNAKYRTWEESLKNNSGAEKFIVYLSIILSIMNYSKSMSTGIRNNSAYSLLILDNPFGSTTSSHILSPMFELAKHFKVQLICLTHITQSDVVKRFDYVIKAFVKKMAMSSKELLKHESSDKIETMNHGFYSVSEQMTLF